MPSFAASIRRRVVIGLTVAAVVATVSVATEQPASAHGACRYRGDRVSGLTASAPVRCATARLVATAYDTAVMKGGSLAPERVRAAGHNCHTTPVGGPDEETFTVRCTRRGSAVHFEWGV